MERSLEMTVRIFATKFEGPGEIGSGNKKSPGTRNVSPYTSFSTEDWRSTFQAVRKPRINNVIASDQEEFSWHIIAALKERCQLSTRSFDCG